MNVEEYDYIKTLDEAKQIIANQDMIIGHQFRQITYLKDSQQFFKYKKLSADKKAAAFDVVYGDTGHSTQVKAAKVDDILSGDVTPGVPSHVWFLFFKCLSSNV